jgi:DNA-binding transcriptional regulator YhcF (GntR family)
MILDVDTSSAVPPYDQVRAQLTSLITGGALAPGTRLPAIRQLAGDLGIAPGTVARAYRELEHAGLVATRGRHGTRVTAPSDPAPATPAHGAHLDEAAAAFAAAAARAGANLDQAVGALRRAFAQMTVAPLADAPPAGAPSPTEPPT